MERLGADDKCTSQVHESGESAGAARAEERSHAKVMYEQLSYVTKANHRMYLLRAAITRTEVPAARSRVARQSTLAGAGACASVGTPARGGLQCCE